MKKLGVSLAKCLIAAGALAALMGSDTNCKVSVDNGGVQVRTEEERSVWEQLFGDKPIVDAPSQS